MLLHTFHNKKSFTQIDSNNDKRCKEQEAIAGSFTSSEGKLNETVYCFHETETYVKI